MALTDPREPLHLPDVVNALNHPLRLQVISALRTERRYVSELARELGISRPLLYMHLERLERAGLVTGSLELSPEGKAIKWYALVPFDLHITPDTIIAALAADTSSDHEEPEPRKGTTP